MNQDLARALQCLNQGAVLAHATETCYGLTCDLFQKLAWERLYELKNMDLSKPSSFLVSDLATVEQFAEFSPKAYELARQFWPGPLTLILPLKLGVLPNWVNPEADSIAIRVSPSPIVEALFKNLPSDRPKILPTTSANLHGLSESYSAEEILNSGLKPDYILNSGVLAKNLPSTLIKVNGGELQILREGPIKIDLESNR